MGSETLSLLGYTRLKKLGMLDFSDMVENAEGI